MGRSDTIVWLRVSRDPGESGSSAEKAREDREEAYLHFDHCHYNRDFYGDDNNDDDKRFILGLPPPTSVRRL